MFQEPSRLQTLTVDGRDVGVRILDAFPPSDPQTSPQALPVVLLHGLGCSADAFRPTLEVMAARQVDFPIYVPDMPGFGCSSGPKQALSIPELADWLAHLLDALGVPKAHFGGNSLGGQVLLALARRHPERVGRMVLVGSTIGEQYISLARYAAGLVLDSIQEPFYYSVVLSRMYFQMGFVRYLATTKAMLEDKPLEYRDEIKAPCLVLRGENDGIIPDPVARRLAAALPNGQFRRLSESAHAMQFTRPREFTEVALAFWGGHVEDNAE